jgi:phosphoribosyl-ATP pyrophosphohydrolase
MAKNDKKAPRKASVKKKAGIKTKASIKKLPRKAIERRVAAVAAIGAAAAARVPPPNAVGASPAVLDRLYDVVVSRKDADPALSHSARLLSRGTAKVAQKFGEEAVECLIEAVAKNADALVGESADVLYHLLVMWVDAGIRPDEVWQELQRREGVSGIAEKASRARKLPARLGVASTKIP